MTGVAPVGRPPGWKPWAEVMKERPDSVRPATLDWPWTRERLWALDLPAERMPVAELAWLLELPMWRHDGHAFTLRPCDVLASPERYHEHAGRIAEADLAWPLHVTRPAERWLVLDGLHRLARAVSLGQGSVEVFKVDPTRYPEFREP